MVKTLRVIVKIYLEQEKIEDALKIARWSQTHFSSAEPPQAAHIATLAIVQVHLFMGRAQEALKAVIPATIGFKEAGDDLNTVAALHLQATANMEVGNPLNLKNALAEAAEALTLSQKLDSKSEEIGTLLLLSNVHLARKDVRLALDAARAGVKIAETCGDNGMWCHILAANGYRYVRTPGRSLHGVASSK